MSDNHLKDMFSRMVSESVKPQPAPTPIPEEEPRPITQAEPNVSAAVTEIANLPLPQENDTGEKKENTAPGILHLSPELLDKYPANPFREYTGSQLEQLVESIREHGVLSPVVVRPKAGGRYEILAGHNRRNAALQAELDEVPCIVKGADDDEAALIVTESNLNQRENLLPSEKAFAYKMQMDAMKKQAGRPAKNNVSQVGTQKRSDQILADEIGESRNQIQRYIRLTYLVDELLAPADYGALALVAAEQVSYLGRGEQLAVYQYFFAEKKAPLDITTATLLRERSGEVELTYPLIDELVQKKQKPPKDSVKLKLSRIRKYVPEGLSKREIEKHIITALDFYRNHAQNNEEGIEPHEQE